MIKKYVLLSLLALFSSVQAQVLVFAYAYNRPDFIEIQHRTLQKFFLDDYELVVFNDARDHNLKEQIEAICAKLAIRCIRIPQEIHDQPYLPRLPVEGNHDPAVRNCNVVQYSLNTLGFDHDDIIILLDSDLFLVKPFSVREFLHNYDLGGFKPFWTEVEYLWIGLVFLDMRTLPNKRTLTFNCWRADGHSVDAGGQSYYYLKNNPGIRPHYINHYYSEDWHCDSCVQTNQPLCTHNTQALTSARFDNNHIRFLQTANRVEFYHNSTFLHYRSGSNWDHKSASYHNMKTQALTTYIASILD
jgi:glycosyltransferase involved in cell wall biosynthesis